MIFLSGNLSFGGEYNKYLMAGLNRNRIYYILQYNLKKLQYKS